MCDVCGGKGEARVIQRDRDGSTAPGSLELLMRSPPPPLVFLSSVSVHLSFSPFPPLNRSTLFPPLGFYTLLSSSLLLCQLSSNPFNLQFSPLYSSSPFSAFQLVFDPHYMAHHPQQRLRLYSYMRDRDRNVIMQLQGSFLLHQGQLMTLRMATVPLQRQYRLHTVNKHGSTEAGRIYTLENSRSLNPNFSNQTSSL